MRRSESFCLTARQRGALSQPPCSSSRGISHDFISPAPAERRPKRRIEVNITDIPACLYHRELAAAVPRSRAYINYVTCVSMYAAAPAASHFGCFPSSPMPVFFPSLTVASSRRALAVPWRRTSFSQCATAFSFYYCNV